MADFVAYPMMESLVGGVAESVGGVAVRWWPNALIRENRERDRRGEKLIQAPLLPSPMENG